MRYRLGILGGLAIMGIVALGLATGIAGSETVEAAKPSVTVTDHSSFPAPSALQGACNINIQVAWEGNAFAHKNGHYRLFLMSQQDGGPLKGEGVPLTRKVDKGTPGGVVQGLIFTGTPDTNYYSWIVCFTSKGKDGVELGRELLRHPLDFSC